MFPDWCSFLGLHPEWQLLPRILGLGPDSGIPVMRPAIGSAVSVISLFLVEEPVAAIAISSVGSGVSIIGFMVWASSYKYLKYAGVMMQAKPYETYLKELQENF